MAATPVVTDIDAPAIVALAQSTAKLYGAGPVGGGQKSGAPFIPTDAVGTRAIVGSAPWSEARALTLCFESGFGSLATVRATGRAVQPVMLKGGAPNAATVLALATAYVAHGFTPQGCARLHAVALHYGRARGRAAIVAMAATRALEMIDALDTAQEIDAAGEPA